MIFITGSDYRFKALLQSWERALSNLGYQYQVYNLGGLDHGVKGFEVDDPNFKSMGYYNSINGKWKSTGLWKPRVIKHALENNEDNIVYLDCDTVVQQPLDIRWPEFDIGVCRRVHNPERDPIKVYLRGDFNAGVILFANNKAVREVVDKWICQIEKDQNDQVALSNILREKAIRVRWFPETWNINASNAIIRHYAGNRKPIGKVRRDVF